MCNSLTSRLKITPDRLMCYLKSISQNNILIFLFITLLAIVLFDLSQGYVIIRRLKNNCTK